MEIATGLRLAACVLPRPEPEEACYAGYSGCGLPRLHSPSSGEAVLGPCPQLSAPGSSPDGRGAFTKPHKAAYGPVTRPQGTRSGVWRAPGIEWVGPEGSARAPLPAGLSNRPRAGLGKRRRPGCGHSWLSFPSEGRPAGAAWPPAGPWCCLGRSRPFCEAGDDAGPQRTARQERPPLCRPSHLCTTVIGAAERVRTGVFPLPLVPWWWADWSV